MVKVQLPPEAPSPRLCLIVKEVPDQEYGFNLHAERGKGQFVGAVDADSVAERSGLRPGDRIFAVNGESIANVSHKEVVRRIKSNSLQCELLVISEEGAQWYADNEILINLLLPNIIRTCRDEEGRESDYIDELWRNATMNQISEQDSLIDDVNEDNEFSDQNLKNTLVVSKARAELRYEKPKITKDLNAINDSVFSNSVIGEDNHAKDETNLTPNKKANNITLISNSGNRVMDNEKDHDIDANTFKIQSSNINLEEGANFETFRSYKNYNYADLLAANKRNIDKNNNNKELYCNDIDSGTIKSNYGTDSLRKSTANFQNLSPNCPLDNGHVNQQRNREFLRETKPPISQQYCLSMSMSQKGEADNLRKSDVIKSPTAKKDLEADSTQQLNSSHSHQFPHSPMVSKVTSSPSVAPRPRLCQLIKSSPADEFGFNLHAERGKGHFIGAVDEGGIAARAGLETGQRIVGVNGQLVFPNTAHKEVVALIKRNPLSTELLVASEEVDRWHSESGVPYSYDCVIVFEPHKTTMSQHYYGSNANNLNNNNNSGGSIHHNHYQNYAGGSANGAIPLSNDAHRRNNSYNNNNNLNHNGSNDVNAYGGRPRGDSSASYNVPQYNKQQKGASRERSSSQLSGGSAGRVLQLSAGNYGSSIVADTANDHRIQTTYTTQPTAFTAAKTAATITISEDNTTSIRLNSIADSSMTAALAAEAAAAAQKKCVTGFEVITDGLPEPDEPDTPTSKLQTPIQQGERQQHFEQQDRIDQEEQQKQLQQQKEQQQHLQQLQQTRTDNNSSPNDLLEQVFSVLRPPPVIASLYGDQYVPEAEEGHMSGLMSKPKVGSMVENVIRNAELTQRDEKIKNENLQYNKDYHQRSRHGTVNSQTHQNNDGNEKRDQNHSSRRNSNSHSHKSGYKIPYVGHDQLLSHYSEHNNSHSNSSSMNENIIKINSLKQPTSNLLKNSNSNNNEKESLDTENKEFSPKIVLLKPDILAPIPPPKPLATMNNGYSSDKKASKNNDTIIHHMNPPRQPSATDDVTQHKHVIADGLSPSSSEVSSNSTTSPPPPPSHKTIPLIIPPRYPSPMALEGGKRASVDSCGVGAKKMNESPSSGKDENQDIFKMSAHDALRAMRQRAGGKKTNDPRLNANLSLEEKYNLIANL